MPSRAEYLNGEHPLSSCSVSVHIALLLCSSVPSWITMLRSNACFAKGEELVYLQVIDPAVFKPCWAERSITAWGAIFQSDRRRPLVVDESLLLEGISPTTSSSDVLRNQRRTCLPRSAKVCPYAQVREGILRLPRVSRPDNHWYVMPTVDPRIPLSRNPVEDALAESRTSKVTAITQAKPRLHTMLSVGPTQVATLCQNPVSGNR